MAVLRQSAKKARRVQQQMRGGRAGLTGASRCARRRRRRRGGRRRRVRRRASRRVGLVEPHVRAGGLARGCIRRGSRRALIARSAVRCGVCRGGHGLAMGPQLGQTLLCGCVLARAPTRRLLQCVPRLFCHAESPALHQRVAVREAPPSAGGNRVGPCGTPVDRRGQRLGLLAHANAAPAAATAAAGGDLGGGGGRQGVQEHHMRLAAADLTRVCVAVQPVPRRVDLFGRRFERQPQRSQRPRRAREESVAIVLRARTTPRSRVCRRSSRPPPLPLVRPNVALAAVAVAATIAFGAWRCPQRLDTRSCRVLVAAVLVFGRIFDQTP
mmetsp:Transcript_15993/g.29089  ORF Transcript_15993/g.29089 Transcript_15993/m.29089 type:complete len:326 (-) Transcript_15993:1128-2105(-)